MTTALGFLDEDFLSFFFFKGGDEKTRIIFFRLRAVWLVRVVTKNKCLSSKILRIMSPGKFTQGHSFMSIKKNLVKKMHM